MNNYIPADSLFKIGINTTSKTQTVVPKKTIPVTQKSSIMQPSNNSYKKASINVKKWSIKIK